MKCFRLLSLAALLISIQLVSIGCHGQAPATYVNDKDQTQKLQFNVAESGKDLRSWFAGDRETSDRGEYVRWNVSAADKHEGTDPGEIVGIYVRTGSEYLLKSPKNGAPDSHFAIQQDSSLRDENGNIWRRDAAPKSVKVKVLKTFHLTSLFHR